MDPRIHYQRRPPAARIAIMVINACEQLKTNPEEAFDTLPESTKAQYLWNAIKMWDSLRQSVAASEPSLTEGQIARLFLKELIARTPDYLEMIGDDLAKAGITL